MSTMAVSSRAMRSTLNPNAPLFIPMAYQQVEDFSPEWWELVKNNSWFRDHWYHQHQEQETFDGEEEDVANLLPESFDLSVTDDFSNFEFEESAYDEAFQAVGEQSFSASLKKDRMMSGLESDAEALIRSLSLKSPRNGAMKPVMEPAKYREKPLQSVNANYSPRRIIHQPR